MEQSFLAYLRGRCRSLPQVAVGIGDDAAVIDSSSGQTIACTDQIIEGVDFVSGEHSLHDVGYKAMAINLSDIAAMGAIPKSALVTLSLPKSNATRIAGDVYEGILEAATEFQVAIAGGDISTYDGPLAISVTLLGEVPTGSAWLRSGAQVDDALLISGAVGGSLRGRHLRPKARIELANRLRELVQVTAAIDISDGLSLDMDRLLAKSGVGVELDIDTIPIHEDAIAMSETSGRTPFEHAWSDGEDFELIVTMSQADADKLAEEDLGVKLTQIGRTTSRTGLWKRENGRHERLAPQGYVHK
ncbi:Thiamine-monophosphate kinase [Rubripirellula amarantea]|uniref:Thiamine-monophosphate kinase n=1 Tax=Rubripirellula amarantea TaxID=2527999 RepID=A0A5C5WPS4_9BACT|nr:thiamine-phosphate kinase [Rubripirellula amarantea]TWT52567.1 Thiamine-monophosphate kinase [Rubripirellula amarantea]